jgi:hypothetical protein
VPTVRLGNTHALDQGKLLDGNRVTTAYIMDENSLESRMRTLTHADGMWPAMSMRPAAWVECDDPELEAALADHFNCPIGEPAGWAE